MDLFLVAIITAIAVGNLVDKLWRRRLTVVEKLNADQAKVIAGLEVRRELSEEWIHALEETNLRIHAELQGAHEVIIELKREGFEIPPSTPQVFEPASSEDLEKVIVDAIAGIAEPGDHAYNQLVADARRDMADEDADADEVAKGIMRGSSYTPYV